MGSGEKKGDYKRDEENRGGEAPVCSGLMRDIGKRTRTAGSQDNGKHIGGRDRTNKRSKRNKGGRGEIKT